MGKFTGVRFYFRDTNSWSNFLELHVGFDASFVLDKTTDSANISFIVQGEPEQIKINTWVALFINTDSSEFEFNPDGTPKNHEQFIVGGYQYYKTLAGYEVTMKLIEPIERFRGVLGETLSYTNQTSKVQDGITYTKEPYNYYTALKRWLQVTPANTDDISRDSEKKDVNGIAWWNRITILDKEFLKSLSFADDTLNELSLYDLLLDVYDSGTGRTPVAYFDLNTATGLPNNLTRDEYLLKFIRQDGADKPIIDWADLIVNKRNGEVCTGIMKREDGGNYATGLVANITNLSPSTTISYPSYGLYAVPEVLADVRDTTISKFNEKYRIGEGDSSWGLVLPHKIKKVTNMWAYDISGYAYKGDYPVSYTLSRTEARVPILERQERYVIDDRNANYYDEGDNIIYLSNYIYMEETPDAGKIPSIFYYVEYEPLIDARIQVGDNEYMQQINQTASQVDSGKFGKFMENYLEGMGKADYTIQRTTENPEDYINLIGSKVRRADKMFMITNIALRNRNLQYDVFFQLNENHLRKNMSYQAPQNIRANTAIQYDNIKDRKVCIQETMKLGLSPVNNELKYLQNKKVILNMLGVSIDRSYYPQFANIITKSKVIKDGKSGDYEETRSAHIVTFSFGNELGINIKFLNNALSGKRKNLQTQENDTVSDVFNRVKSQIPMLYTDPFGEVQKTSIQIISPSINSPLPPIQSNPFGAKKSEYDKTVDYQNIMLSLFNEAVEFDKIIVNIDNLNLQKDMLEEYNITYGIRVEGKDGIIVLPALLQYSRLMYAQIGASMLQINLYKYADAQDLLKIFYVYDTIVGDDYIEFTWANDENNILTKSSFKALGLEDYSSAIIGTGVLDMLLINSSSVFCNDEEILKTRIYI